MSSSSSSVSTTSSSDVDQILGGKDNNNKVCVSIQDALRVFGKPGVKFVDGSWFLKGRNGRTEYESGPRIRGALFFDIDDVCSPKGHPKLNPKSLPHMMPSPEIFARAMDKMGIVRKNTVVNNDEEQQQEDHVIVYGSPGCLFVHRAWFQMRNMGHTRTHLLSGSWQDWKDAGGPMEEGETTSVFRMSDINNDNDNNSPPTAYQVASDTPMNIYSMQDMLDVIDGKREGIIVDVRAAERYRGDVEEPRPGMRLGHMPGSLNLPFTDLLQPDNPLKFKPKEELLEVMKKAGMDDDVVTTPLPIIASCGSGATACALVAALEVCGREPTGTYVYDGSWSEWGAEQDTPILKGVMASNDDDDVQ